MEYINTYLQHCKNVISYIKILSKDLFNELLKKIFFVSYPNRRFINFNCRLNNEITKTSFNLTYCGRIGYESDFDYCGNSLNYSYIIECFLSFFYYSFLE